MNNYKGTIIEESLCNKEVLKKVKIISTRVERVVDKHQTPWLSQWTLHKVEVPENKAKTISEEISKSFDRNHGGSWYADFKNSIHHYIIFPDKVFLIDRRSREQYNKAKHYGISLGIPEYQVDFHPEIEKWKR